MRLYYGNIVHGQRKNGSDGDFRPQTRKVMGALPPRIDLRSTGTALFIARTISYVASKPSLAPSDRTCNCRSFLSLGTRV